jgi:hypothetical protein
MEGLHILEESIYQPASQWTRKPVEKTFWQSNEVATPTCSKAFAAYGYV